MVEVEKREKNLQFWQVGGRVVRVENSLARKVLSETWTDSVGDVQSSLPAGGWNLSSHLPVGGR